MSADGVFYMNLQAGPYMLFQEGSYLIKFFDPEDQGQRIMIAELYRNLGEFDKCIELIDSVDGDTEIKAYIKERFTLECQQGNKFTIGIYGPPETREKRLQPLPEAKREGFFKRLRRRMFG